MGAEQIVMVIPFDPGPAFDMGEFAFRSRNTQGAQDSAHAGAGDFAHTQKNKLVAVGNQHWFMCFNCLLVAVDFDGIIRIPQYLKTIGAL